MASAKIAFTMDESTLHRLDRLVEDGVFPNRSQAIQDAVEETMKSLERNRLARECTKLDAAVEKVMAEEGMGEELEQWPEYRGAPCVRIVVASGGAQSSGCRVQGSRETNRLRS